MHIKRSTGLIRNRLLMSVGDSSEKGVSGMDKFGSNLNRMHMELRGKFANSIRIKTRVLERLRSMSILDSATVLKGCCGG